MVGITRRVAPGRGLAGGTRERHFAGINLKPYKLPENAQTHTTMAPALFLGLGALIVRLIYQL